MESNQKFMILSLLNLYLEYIETKTEKKQDIKKQKKLTYRPRRYITRRDIPSINNIINDNAKTASESEKDCGSVNNTSAVTNQNEQATSSNVRTSVKANKTGKQRKSTDPNHKPRVRRWAVRPINRDWALSGFQRKVFANVKNMDQEQFFAHTRMSKSLFDWLLSFTQSSLKKSRQRILAEERLVITLNFLAYGTRMQSIAFKHKVGRSTIREILIDTCKVLWNLLSPIYFSEPETSQYGDIANDFKSKYDVPNCVGAIDGKFVSIRVPGKTKYVPNERDCSKVLLMGVCDAKYKFTSISAEIYDNQKDEGIFQLSPYVNAIVSEKLPLPSNKPLYPSSPPFPHYFVTNTSFPLRKNIMRPYATTNLDTTKAIFNYKISRAHSVAENSFGILIARWRILTTTIEFLPETCKSIILACVALHNYIMTNDEEQLYCPPNFIDREGQDGNIILGEWRNELRKNGDKPLETVTTYMRRSSYEANKLRDTLANFFASETVSYEIDVV